MENLDLIYKSVILVLILIIVFQYQLTENIQMILKNKVFIFIGLLLVIYFINKNISVSILLSILIAKNLLSNENFGFVGPQTGTPTNNVKPYCNSIEPGYNTKSFILNNVKYYFTDDMFEEQIAGGKYAGIEIYNKTNASRPIPNKNNTNFTITGVPSNYSLYATYDKNNLTIVTPNTVPGNQMTSNPIHLLNRSVNNQITVSDAFGQKNIRPGGYNFNASDPINLFLARTA